MYDQNCGRLRVRVSYEGVKDHNYSHGAEVFCRAGWNDSCRMVGHVMSVEELRDLRHLLDRAIAAAERS